MTMLNTSPDSRRNSRDELELIAPGVVLENVADSGEASQNQRLGDFDQRIRVPV